MKHGISRRGALAAGLALGTAPVLARAAAPDPVRIGVLTDASGPYAAVGGPGCLAAARIAAADFGGTVLGRNIKVTLADTQNKPNLAASIARKWYDHGYDAVTDLPLTPVAIAVLDVAKEKRKTVMITASAITQFTSSPKFCSPFSSHWADDVHAMTTGTAKLLTRRGGKRWYFLTVDFIFGRMLQAAAAQVIETNGGQVLGQSYFPPGNADFSSQLLVAQSSGADVIGFAAVGDDLDNAIKQAHEFGLTRGGKTTLAGFLVYITDIHALGLPATQGFVLSSSFYWNQSPTARRFAARFRAVQAAEPNRDHAMNYVATLHFLKAMAQAGTRDALAVNKAMRAMPVDYMGHPASVRADGRVLYDVTLWRVKLPTESKGDWDLYTPLGTLPPAEAFLPMNPACSS